MPNPLVVTDRWLDDQGRIIHGEFHVGEARAQGKAALARGEVDLSLLDEEVDLRADGLKVSHHGAATSTEPFFEAVDAQVAVVSVGPNTYGHPVPEVLGWIRATGARVLRTDFAGTVTIRFDARGVLVESAG